MQLRPGWCYLIWTIGGEAMITTNKSTEKPCVLIYVVPHPNDQEKVREVRAGMEEEGIPCTLLQGQGTDNIALAYQGASSSQLGVGMGIGPNNMCIHYHKLPPREPLFISVAGAPEEWRRFGSNAARLVKGIPFKKPSVTTCHQALQKDELEHLVRSVITRLLKDTEKTMGR